MLNLVEIRKDYKTASETVRALRGVSITFRKNEFVSILGPSGCGKTTLLNIIGGLDHYTDGDLMINGRSTKLYTDRDWDVYRNHRVGFIFQSYNLIPHQTILGNVELALTIAGIGKEERIERAKKALDRVGLADQYYKRPNQLSGGQCQRVAIARALVNDPEILLADEPTGALDTVTSVQIMDLIREIAEERLVIMVTHNPELAEQYSTRIIRLLDGSVIEDTNPCTEESEAEEIDSFTKEYDSCNSRDLECKDNESSGANRKKKRRNSKSGREKAKMSFFTAFKLSARNLLSKKGRTTMVGFAGSIGIIGIAMVLAFSAGIKGYIASMQDDMLSGNPITITQTAYDLSSITGMMQDMSTKAGTDREKEPGRIYMASLIEYLTKMNKKTQDIVMENDITKEYIDYVCAMPKEYYNALILGYGINMTANIFTDFKYDEDSDAENISLHRLLNVAKSVLSETEIKDNAESIVSLAPSLRQLPNNKAYIESQYELVGNGKIAESKDEIMIVLNSDDELSDILLARLGYFTQAEILEIVNKANSDNEEYTSALYKDSFTYDEIVGKTFTWYPNDTVFTEVESMYPGMPSSYTYNSISTDFDDEGKLELRIVGILTPKDNVSYGSLTSGIYYTEELTKHILEANADSNIEEYVKSEEAAMMLSATAYNLIYTYSYSYDSGNGEPEVKTAMGTIGPDLTTTEMLEFAIDREEALKNLDKDDMTERFARMLGGIDVANSVTIYPLSFEDKGYVTDYLDEWNKDGELSYSDITIPKEDRNEITYTDTIELVVNLINTMIDVVTYALVAFTSISLVVSTVMIGIITYVSVVERIKEIGVIRSLGGRKKDVSHLFNAETFIIGLLAGIFGVAVTYVISAIVNVLLTPLIGYTTIAALPVSQGILLIVLSVLLTLISGLIPASSAAKKDPVVALRTE